MKVCPYCTAINEEKNANKCCVCGKSIVSETEYSESDLEDNSIKQYILLKQEKIKRNKILKILIPIIIAVVLLITSIIIYNVTRPKGHIIIRESLYIAYVGDRIEIAPEFYGDIKAEDLKWDMKLNSTGEEVPFRYEIIDNKFYLDLMLPDEIEITFKPKDDGMQHKYNNTVKIYILSKEPGDVNE